MPGRDLWNPSVANSFRDRRVPNFDSTDPEIKPMFQDSTSIGLEYQVGLNSSLGVHYIHNDLGDTIEDLGGLVNGDEVYVIGNPGGGALGTITPTSGRTAPFATPKPVRTYDALELTYSRRFANNWFGSASYTYSRLYGNYAGLASSDEILTPTTNVGVADRTAAGLQHLPTGRQREPGLGHRRAADRLPRWHTGRRPRAAGHRPSARRQVLRRVFLPVRDANRGQPLRRQRHPNQHRMSSPSTRPTSSWKAVATWAARRC